VLLGVYGEASGAVRVRRRVKEFKSTSVKETSTMGLGERIG
jgi:hypothetical protein